MVLGMLLGGLETVRLRGRKKEMKRPLMKMGFLLERERRKLFGFMRKGNQDGWSKWEKSEMGMEGIEG